MDTRPNGDEELPDTTKRRLRRKPIIGGIVLVLAAAVVVTVVTIAGNYGPEATVDRYLTAVKNRDVDAALAEVRPDTVTTIRQGRVSGDAFSFEGRDVFLNKKAMRTDWTFDSISDSESADGPSPADSRYVTANINGFGATAEATFEVTETADGWKLSNPFGYVVIEHTSLTYLDVDGVRFPDPEPHLDDPRPRLPIFPGTHRFFDGLPGDVDAAKPSSLDQVVAPGPIRDEYRAGLGELTLKGGLLDEARRQVNMLLDTCADSKDVEPRMPDDSHCPFALDSPFELGGETYYAEQGTAKWTVAKSPGVDVVDFRADGADEAPYSGFETVPQEPGTLTVTGSAEGVHGTEGHLNFTLECEYDGDGIRGRLDEDDSFTMRKALGPHRAPFNVSRTNDACNFKRV